MIFIQLSENTKIYHSVSDCTNVKFFPNTIIRL